MDNHLSKVALVTGASSGIGASTALRLAGRGWRVFGTSRDGARSPGESVEMLALDVDDDASVRACVDKLFRRTGHRIDVLVNNAGRAMLGASEETDADEARALFETNVFGVMRVTNAVLATMREQGAAAIVNVGSVSGFVGVPFHGVYAASKHALAGYTEALHHEVAPFGIRVALIEPAAHRTTIQMIRPRRRLACYDAARDYVGSEIRTQIESGKSADDVVDAIESAAIDPSPALRYRVGSKAQLAAVAKRLLPERAFTSFVRREFSPR